MPLIVHWPDGVSDAGTVRDQFHHVNDVAPTVYDLLGITAPDVYRGREQLPVSGQSMSYTFDRPDAPTTKRPQYYEMFGHRAIVADGWKAVTRHTAGVPFDDDTWELYHYDIDRSECHDLAAAMPDKLAELVALWWEEAEDQGVLPLDDRSIELFFTRYRDNSVHPTDRRYTYYPPMAPLPAQVAPGMGGRGFDLAATIDRPAGAGGVLFATGTENSGLSVFVQDDRLVFDYNCFNDHHVVGVHRRRTGRAVRRGRALPARGPEDGGALRRRRRRAATSGAVRHAHHLERRARASATTTAARSASATPGTSRSRAPCTRSTSPSSTRGTSRPGAPEAHQRAAMAQQ